MYICTYVRMYIRCIYMYIHRILARRISHGNHSYCTNKMADGFRFRLAVRRGSCADLVSRLADGAEGDEEGQNRSGRLRARRITLPEMSNLKTQENVSTRGRITCTLRWKPNIRSDRTFRPNLPTSLLALIAR